MTNFITTTKELSLQEMLTDPIVQTMMARDGVTKQDVEGLIETVRSRRAIRQIAARESGRHGFNPVAFEGLSRLTECDGANGY